jgi:hypothetical protein
MKILYLLVVSFSLTLIGCSSTYKVSDFASRDKFYEDFNNFARSKSVKITLNNDSSFNAERGAYILNDSLMFISIVQKEEKIDRNEIKDIKYSGTDITNLTAAILLKNGNSVIVRNINPLSDSSVIAVVSESNNGYLPVIKIKKISCQNKLLGALLGFVYGIPAGYIAGNSLYFFFSSPPGRGGAGSNVGTDLFLCGLFSAPIISIIIGSINGYTYTYLFSQ